MQSPKNIEEHPDKAKGAPSRPLSVTQENLEQAVKEGILSPSQAEQLWNAFMKQNARHSRLNLAHLFWYAGSLLIFIAMGWFANEMTLRYGPSALLATSLAYLAIFLLGSAYLWFKQHLKVPAGLLFLLALLMVPVICYSFADTFHYSTAFAHFAMSVTYLISFLCTGAYLWYHEQLKVAGGLSVTLAIVMAPIAVDALDRTLLHPILFYLGNHGFAFFMQGLLIGPALLALWFFKFPLLTALIAFALCWMSDTTASALFASSESLFVVWNKQATVPMLFGFGMICTGFILDSKRDGDFGFWCYLFGACLFSYGLFLQPSTSELSKFIFFLINLGLMLTSVLLSRIIFLICGSLGVLHYLWYLLERFFTGSILFPFALILLGLGVILAGVKYHTHKAAIDKALLSLLPSVLRKHLPK